MAVFPVFLKLEGRRVLVVGAGPVAASKLRPLVDAGARVTVVAPRVVEEVAGLASRIGIVRRPFEPGDVDGVSYIIAAAPPEVNRAVAQAAESKCLFVNAVDDLESASAYAGAIVQKAGVTIALSTDGEAPALAGLVREALEALLPDELDRWMACAVGPARMARAGCADARAASAFTAGAQRVVRAEAHRGRHAEHCQGERRGGSGNLDRLQTL